MHESILEQLRVVNPDHGDYRMDAGPDDKTLV